MTDYIAQVTSAIHATVIHSPSAYSWFNKLHRLPRTVLRLVPPDIARAYLVSSLQNRLYTDFYCRGFATPAVTTRMQEAPVPVRALPFVEQLSMANTGTGHPEPGWSVQAVESPFAVLVRDGLRIRAHLDECGSDAPIREGQFATVRLPSESWAASPGFYLARSDTSFPKQTIGKRLRLYWNVTPSGAPHLVRAVTTSLNRAEVPFLLKVSIALPYTPRCDAAVLYVLAEDEDVLEGVASSTYRSLRSELYAATPAFTKALAAGLGLAEDPEESQSFGLHRCGLLAEAMVRAHEQRIGSLDGRLRLVETHFSERGFSLDRPYVGEHSANEYDFRVSVRHVSEDRLASSIPRPGPAPAGSVLLRTAHDIGRQLSATAVWHEGRCTWVGARNGASAGHAAGIVEYGTLAADMYSGTSGVALFLAHLYSATGDDAVGRTALGAVRHALSKLDAVPPRERIGLYTGWTGIALVAARVAALLPNESLLDNAHQVVRRCERELKDVFEFDLLSGAAGAITALLALDNLWKEQFIVDFAVRLGNELLRTAERSAIGWSWKGHSPSRRNLTGLSHGTSGAGAALIELFNATGLSDFRTAAELAFGYERHWFDPVVRNWPDFRGEPAGRRLDRRTFSFATAWCHGAPGIALSRIRAYHILRDDLLRTESVHALDTTRASVSLALDSPNSDFCLCHGISGNAESLVYGAQVLGSDAADCLVAAQEAGYAGIEAYGKRGGAWPCGVHGEQTPGLMIGLAGIGYFYLRLNDISVPSVLLPHRPETITDDDEQKGVDLALDGGT